MDCLKKSTHYDGNPQEDLKVFSAAGWSMNLNRVRVEGESLGYVGALGKYFFRASVYISNLSHSESMSQHHSGDQNS